MSRSKQSKTKTKANLPVVVNPVGAPPDPAKAYKPEYCDLLIKHAQNAKSFSSFGAQIGVGLSQCYKWLGEQPEFAQAYDAAKAILIDLWEDAARNIGMGIIPKLPPEAMTGVERMVPGNARMAMFMLAIHDRERYGEFLRPRGEAPPPRDVGPTKVVFQYNDDEPIEVKSGAAEQQPAADPGSDPTPEPGDGGEEVDT